MTQEFITRLFAALMGKGNEEQVKVEDNWILLWGYKKCQYCNGTGSWPDTGFDRKQCPSCNGTGRICKYPEAEKLIKGGK